MTYFNLLLILIVKLISYYLVELKNKRNCFILYEFGRVEMFLSDNISNLPHVQKATKVRFVTLLSVNNMILGVIEIHIYSKN